MSRLETLKKQIILEANIKLSEQAAVANKAVATPATPAVANPLLEKAYTDGIRTIWQVVRNGIVYGGRTAGTNKTNGIMSWVYPKGTKEAPVKLYDERGQIVNQTILDAYDKLFNDKLSQATNDDGWLNEMGKAAFTANPDIEKNKLLQQYLVNTITDKNLVKDNGSGGAFVDGQFHSVTMKALINVRIQKGYRDSGYMIGQKLL